MGLRCCDCGSVGWVGQKMTADFPTSKFARLHVGEEFLRSKGIEVLVDDERLQLHIEVVEVAMNIADWLRCFETNNEDLKLIQVLGIRIFNAFGSSLKLCLSGYYQNAALILRDVLETVFLIDLFCRDRSLIAAWRAADRAKRMKQFSPVKVRTMLDTRDGFTEGKRAGVYSLFSELVGHATMQSITMLRPNGMDVHCGPFFDATALEAVIYEMGRLAVQVGEILDIFKGDLGYREQANSDAFGQAKARWIAEFYPDSA